MEFDKSAWDDFEVDPRGFTEEDRAIIRAYIAIRKEQKKQMELENKSWDDNRELTEEDWIAIGAYIATHKEPEKQRPTVRLQLPATLSRFLRYARSFLACFGRNDALMKFV